MLLVGNPRLVEITIARHRVEQLVIDRRRQNDGQSVLQRGQFRAHRFAALRKLETGLYGCLDRLRIGNEFHTVLTNPFMGFALVAQLRQQQVEGVPFGVHSRGDIPERPGVGGSQSRRRRDQGAALLHHGERRLHLRHAVFVHPALHVPDAVEGKPAHQAGECGEGNRKADTGIESDRNPAAGQQQAPQILADHRTRPLSESTSR